MATPNSKNRNNQDNEPTRKPHVKKPETAGAETARQQTSQEPESQQDNGFAGDQFWLDQWVLHQAVADPHTINPNNINSLQRTVGNRSTQILMAHSTASEPAKNGLDLKAEALLARHLSQLAGHRSTSRAATRWPEDEDEAAVQNREPQPE